MSESKTGNIFKNQVFLFIILICLVVIALGIFFEKKAILEKAKNNPENASLQIPTATPQPLENLTNIDFSKTELYVEKRLGIKFMYLVGTTIFSPEPDSQGSNYISLNHDGLNTPEIRVEENKNDLSAKEWFSSQKNNYLQSLIRVLGEKKINGGSVYVIGQPDTCQTAPMIMVWVSKGRKIYQISHFGDAIDKTPIELQLLLSNFSFIEDSEKLNIPYEWIAHYPLPPKETIKCDPF